METGQDAEEWEDVSVRKYKNWYGIVEEWRGDNRFGEGEGKELCDGYWWGKYFSVRFIKKIPVFNKPT